MNIETLVDSLNKDLGREYAHMHFYLTAETNVRGLHREQLSEFFAKEANGERRHVGEFRRMIIGLMSRTGIKSPVTSTPSDYVGDLTCPIALLKEALRMEDEVVSNYVTRIDDAQALQEQRGIQVLQDKFREEDKTDGKWVELFLEEQILDSRRDADEIREMLMSLGHDPA